MVARHDVVTTVLGASAGLAGLTLVFLGVILSTYRQFDATTSARVLARYRRPALVVLITFGCCLVTVLLCAVWLLAPSSDALYVLSLVLFFGELAALGGSAAYVLRRVMWS